MIGINNVVEELADDVFIRGIDLSQPFKPMTEEQLKDFLAKVQADTSLQEQLKAEGADVVAIAKTAGFSITTEDLNAHRQALSGSELSLNILTDCKNIFLLM